jgi:hypothetical protein
MGLRLRIYYFTGLDLLLGLWLWMELENEFYDSIFYVFGFYSVFVEEIGILFLEIGIRLNNDNGWGMVTEMVMKYIGK